MNRADHHDAAAFALGHHSSGCELAAMERAPQDDIPDLLDIGHLQLEQRFSDTSCGIVDEDVEPAKPIHDRQYGPFHGRTVGDVSLKVERLASEILDLADSG